MRLTVETWDEELIVGYETNDTSKAPIKVRHTPVWHLAEQLYPSATLNLLDIKEDDEGTLHPRLIILEPDYLVDITTICQCVKPCGITPLHYLMAKFMPREDTLAIQLGNVANQFMDDAVNRTGTFTESMQKSFKDYPLKYCTLEGVDQKFFSQCRAQYDNLQAVTHTLFPQHGIDVARDKVQLEPSFICEFLGLQGRMDLLTGDLSKIVELKSGKCDEYHNTFKTEHAWQMALYKEILHYSLGKAREEVKTLLLYSKYPELYDIDLDQQNIAKALAVRNGIVHLDRILRSSNCKDFLLSLTEDDFNPLHATGKLYQSYMRPRILSFLGTLQGASPIEFDYFCTMLSFVQREQFYAKVGDSRPESDRAFARAWLCNAKTKCLNGNMLPDLRLSPIVDEEGMLTHLIARLPETDNYESNFREGDGVVLYERNTDTDLITNRQSLRCNIEQMHTDHFLLRLAYPQREAGFINTNHRYAIEPSYSDSLFASQYRGLYALLLCPTHRRQLILAQRIPESSKDYFLLVGPPGSGKTSIALRKMVEDFIATQPTESILLMAYTNRAVDEICQMLEGISDSPHYVRIGQESSCGQAFRPRLIRNVIADCGNRARILQRLQPIRIFCGTVSSLCAMPELFRLRQFHTAILDEASQVLEPQLLPLLCATTPQGEMGIGRLILIGDHKQLPAVVVQPREESTVTSETLHEIGLRDCRDSLFERLFRLIRQNAYDGLDGMLKCQGRMHETISRFVNERYYEGQLSTVPLPHQTEPRQWPRYDKDNTLQAYLATHRMGVFDVPSQQETDNDRINEEEASVIAQIIEQLHNLSLANNLLWNPQKQIGIIVPFRGQITAIRHQLESLNIPKHQEITIDTVERFQGSQRDIIVFSTVIHKPWQLRILSCPVACNGSLIDRKLNVAISRARKQFLLVGNLQLLRQANDYRKFIDYCL